MSADPVKEISGKTKSGMGSALVEGLSDTTGLKNRGMMPGPADQGRKAGGGTSQGPDGGARLPSYGDSVVNIPGETGALEVGEKGPTSAPATTARNTLSPQPTDRRSVSSKTLFALGGRYGGDVFGRNKRDRYGGFA